MNSIRTLTLSLSLAAVATNAFGQQPVTPQVPEPPQPPAPQDDHPELVIARAIGKAPSPEVVRFVARNSEPVVVDPAQRPEIIRATYRQLIERRCGSVDPTYLEEFQRINQFEEFKVDSQIGDTRSIVVPACLFARTQSNALKYVIKPGDTMTGIRERFTGEGEVDIGALRPFFRVSGLRVSDARRLMPGREIVIPDATAATVLHPRLSNEAFLAEIQRLSQGNVVAEANPESSGTIIGPVHFATEEQPAGTTQGTFRPCNAGDASKPYPFDGVVVENTYLETRKKITAAISPVSVVIVDNGFFGVPCSADGCPPLDEMGRPKYSDRFPGAFFDYDAFEKQAGFGPLLSGSGIDPVNYHNRIAPTSTSPKFTASDVNDETGHGTHVAGLSIGGPDFVSHRAVFYDAGLKPWMKLAIANISRGSSKISIGADRNMDDLLAQIYGFKIVNMSVAFDARIDPNIAKVLEEAIADDEGSLFVVAAGNNGQPLNLPTLDVYPAKFGAGRFKNVITVASVDGPIAGAHRISDFSNRGNSYVDMAAPGCMIPSWINAELDPVPISGTSQAAPLVTFAASLLRSLWNVGPLKIKNRLLYSGDLLDDAKEADWLASKSRLNIEKALAFPWTRVEFERDGSRRVLLGSIRQVSGLQCSETDVDVPPGNVRAIKRHHDGRLAIFTIDAKENLSVCWGQARQDVTLDFTAEREIYGGQLTAPGPNAEGIKLSEVSEIIRSR